MIKPRTKTPDINLNLVNDTEWTLSQQSPEAFTIVIFYRGLHCPICKSYLEDFQSHLNEFTELGINLIAISNDSEERAKKTHQKWDIPNLPLGYEFPIESARDWGLYVSSGIKEEPEQFFEPGLFIIRPNQELYAASIQTMPFARNSVKDLIKGLKYIINNDYPARGEV